MDHKKCCKPSEIAIMGLPSDEEARDVASFFKAISDPARVKIICALANGELCVCELMEAMGMQQTVVSHHLKILKYAGIVSDRKSGKWVNYSLADRRALEAIKALGLISP